MNSITEPGLTALNQSLQLSREPLPGSSKLYLAGTLHPSLRVPMRAIALTNGETITVYDPSGPYTDPAAAIDVRRGLPAPRAAWVEARQDTEAYEGRSIQLIDDGLRDQAQQLKLHEISAGLQRRPRRAKSQGTTSRSCTTRAAASSRRRWSSSRSARISAMNGCASTRPTPSARPGCKARPSVPAFRR